MDITKPNIILAGSTGLIGSFVLQHLLKHSQSFTTLYAPTRSPLSMTHPQLSGMTNDEFFQSSPLSATLGIICLGTTKKAAGSNEALYAIDHDLVVQFANKMKQFGVTHIAVVSSYGAKVKSSSHYLKCKGEMERDVYQLGFEHVLFARPGPLKGKRDKPRTDEVLLQKMVKFIQPLMLGPLVNLRPINAQHVAHYLVEELINPKVNDQQNSKARNEAKFAYYLDMIQ
ncbi:hypothetical protein A9264_03025 [Vibrio sp. UCD-FRSSP16_10]|uniref:hypothetical protein n=1 Tax=unclassified Vibrio TaxID=2614977 RepID=UPI0007FC2042|nr:MULTISPECIES: hypothetical protein [unclassified Vibrio]OBT12128.1 hypothetical protein A9260_04475 [Vibrio sp. UCD-FRSSP16_30]OBT20459.1 hypothetical protein A9264_03025 [Vibrio sp. UCD-FRSSP16_10]